MSSYDRGGSPQRAAFRTTPLVSDFNGKIESITHYSSRVVVGSSDGRLTMYDTRKTSSSVAASYKFDHDRGVEQILAVPHIRMIIVISNGEVSAHGATNLKPLEFDFSKANADKVKICCINQRGPPHFRLGVASVKRKAILIYQFYNSDKSYKYLREFTTQDIPEYMAWYRNKVVVGYRKDYYILNDKTGEAIPMNSASMSGPDVRPVVKLLPREEVLITAMDKVGVFMNLSGEPLPKNSINWSQSPASVEYSAPYLIGMIPRVGIEIHSMLDNTAVQNISLPGVWTSFSNGMKWDMDPRPSGDSEDIIIVAVREGSSSSVLKVEQMPMEQQIGDLLDRGRIDEAQDIMKKSISGLPSEKQRSKMKRFQRQAAIALLRRLEFDYAADYMYKSALEPCEFIAFFPEYQCASFAYEPSILIPEVLPRGSSVSPNITSVISEILSTKKSLLSDSVSKSNIKSLEKDAVASLMKFLELFKKHIRDKLQTRSRSNTASSSRSRSISVASSLNTKDPRRAEAVDTALLRLYVYYRKQKEMITLIQENEVNPSSLELHSCQSLLMKNEYYYQAGLLFQIHGRYHDALDIFESMANGKYNQTNSIIKGLDAAVETLISLGEEYESVVFEKSVWIIKYSPLNALRIFTERRPLPSSSDVSAHLKKYSEDRSIVQKYLEMLVSSERGNGGSSNPAALELNESYSYFLAGDNDFATISNALVDPHHTRLAVEYIDEALKHVRAGEVPSKTHPGRESGALGDARKRLLKFLKSSSSHYDVPVLATKLNRTPLYNEFVVLCGRGSMHEEALQCLLYELNDVKGAENYCLKYGQEKKCQQNHALLVLLKLCLRPSEESKKLALNDYAFQLLGRHGKYIDGKAALELLPSSTPLNKLLEYFSQLLPSSSHNAREMMLKKSLSNIYNLQVQCDRVEKRSHFVEIDPSTTCYSCKKRIGDIVFAVYPNGKVVHYNCTNGNLDVCPTTGEKFD